MVAENRAAQVADPRPYATFGVAEIYARYPRIGPVLPAMGYSPEQLEALRGAGT